MGWQQRVGIRNAQMVLAYWHMRKAKEDESHCEAAASFYQVTRYHGPQLAAPLVCPWEPSAP